MTQQLHWFINIEQKKRAPTHHEEKTEQKRTKDFPVFLEARVVGKRLRVYARKEAVKDGC